MASVLFGTTTRKDFWYCPTMKNKTIYFNDVYIAPPLYNCVLAALKLDYDESTKYFKDIDGVSLSTKDWGGITGFQFGEILPGWVLIQCFDKIIDYLKGYGYAVGESIFGAPYDWRLGSKMPNSFWEDLKGLVEQASAKNGNSKVAILGHSLGGFLVQRFLTQHTESKWRKDYIDCAILLAPSFGGAGQCVKSLVTGRIPKFGGVFAKSTDSALRSLGSLVAQLPNFELLKDKTIIIDSDGNSIKAPEVPDFLLRQGFVDEKLLSVEKDEPTKPPEAPDVPVALFYNTQIKTLAGYDMQKEEDIEYLGDGTVLAEGGDYACNNWKGNLVCHDFHTDDTKFNHGGITREPSAVELEMSYILNDDWKKQ